MAFEEFGVGEIFTIEPGTPLYHSSQFSEQLAASGKFNPLRSSYRGAIFLASEQTVHANFVVEATDEIRLLDVTGSWHGWYSLLQQQEKPEFREIMHTEGLDGFVADNHDPMTRLKHWPTNVPRDIAAKTMEYCLECIVVEPSLDKLGAVSLLGNC